MKKIGDRERQSNRRSVGREPGPERQVVRRTVRTRPVTVRPERAALDRQPQQEPPRRREPLTIGPHFTSTISTVPFPDTPSLPLGTSIIRAYHFRFPPFRRTAYPGYRAQRYSGSVPNWSFVHLKRAFLSIQPLLSCYIYSTKNLRPIPQTISTVYRLLCIHLSENPAICNEIVVAFAGYFR